MKPIKSGIAVLITFASLGLGGCTGIWERHMGTQSAPYPDQSYWQERQWRQDIARQQREADRNLSRVRLGEFIR